MAQVTRYPFVRHLRSEASQYILHHVTPDLLGAAFQQVLRDDGARGT